MLELYGDCQNGNGRLPEDRQLLRDRVPLQSPDWDGGLMEEYDASASSRYAAALRASFQPCGLTQKELAERTPFSETSISRYFSGERLADRKFIEHLVAVRAECRAPMDAEEQAALHGLRALAQRSRGGEKNRIAQWQDHAQQLEAEKDALSQRLREARSQAEQDRHLGEAALAALDRELARLNDELSQALERAGHAETESDGLRAQTEEQRHQLAHAAAYIQDLEKELRSAHTQLEELQREVRVLQDQVHQLLDPPREQGESQRWLRSAAEAGDVDAMIELGRYYEEETDEVIRAEHWYRRAAIEGSTDAMTLLGNLLVSQGDPIEASEWHDRSMGIDPFARYESEGGFVADGSLKDARRRRNAKKTGSPYRYRL
ncbi:hypothetical protein [Streptomyces sp. NPDC015350]|uniref:hypothetical protein n=1 Tax=Streptomyces sp. NPDC015350 TaxID=3364955 RepID=UPI0036FDE205